MKLVNKLIVYSKRILHKKMYITMLLFLLTLSVIYALLPPKTQSADIKVLLYSEDSSEYSQILFNDLTTSASVYSFETVDNLNKMINMIKRNDAECGYFFQDGFFDSYVTGKPLDKTNIIQYISPGTTMSKPISETVFCHIFKMLSSDILYYCADMPEYRNELDTNLEKYLNSDEIFTLEDTSDGSYTVKDMIYKINIPIFEISCILILFASLLGLLSHIEDSEKGFFLGIQNSEVFLTKNICIFSSVVPVTAISIICAIVSNLALSKIILILIFSILCHIFTLLLNFFIKKSTPLLRVLPVIMFISAIVVFVLGLF